LHILWDKEKYEAARHDETEDPAKRGFHNEPFKSISSNFTLNPFPIHRERIEGAILLLLRFCWIPCIRPGMKTAFQGARLFKTLF
jgi:hypothetical protein